VGLYLNGSWWLDYNGNNAWNGVPGGDRQYNYGVSGVPVVGKW